MPHLHLTGIEQSEKKNKPMDWPMWLQLNDNTERQNLSIKSVFYKTLSSKSVKKSRSFIHMNLPLFLKWKWPYSLVCGVINKKTMFQK